jgi:hypothetical protein
MQAVHPKKVVLKKEPIKNYRETNTVSRQSTNGVPEKSDYIRAMEHLEQTFSTARNVPLPDWARPKETNKLYRIPLSRIYRLCDNNLDAADSVVRAVVAQMMRDGLPFSRPVQILKVAESYIADRKPRASMEERA